MDNIRGPWSFEEATSFLNNHRSPIRVAFNDVNNIPAVVSLWFQYIDGRFYCVTHRKSWVIKCLERNDLVGFEVATNEPPYRGVRGRAQATLFHEGAGEQLEQLIRRYLGKTDSTLAKWLLSRKEDELIIQLEPLGLSSWDYTERMGDAVMVG